MRVVTVNVRIDGRASLEEENWVRIIIGKWLVDVVVVHWLLLAPGMDIEWPLRS